MRGKSIKNCSFANCFITLMGQSLYINCHMRTPTLQYLYLQKPVTMMVVICIISVLPWIGLGDFSTKGEPQGSGRSDLHARDGQLGLATILRQRVRF